MDKNYTFVFLNGGWWLKIRTMEELVQYYENIDAKWGKILYNIVESKEFGTGQKHIDENGLAVALFAANRGFSPIEGVMNFRLMVFKQQLECIEQFGEIYINRRGGYCFKSESRKYEQFVHREKFIFPDFKKEDIRIKKFPMGQHYYVYIGDMEVREGDQVKWNTYDEAQRVAERYISE